MGKKIWNLMYRVGSTARVIGSADNPQTRKSALEGADTITKNRWCVWIEHHTSGKILYRNSDEVDYQRFLDAKRVIEFA